MEEKENICAMCRSDEVAEHFGFYFNRYRPAAAHI
jgi:hypothetical protein